MNEGDSMRDIRADLEERAAVLESQINSADAQFDKLVEQLKAEYETRLKNVQAEFDAVRVLLSVEDRRLANGTTVPKPQAQARPPQPKPEQAQPAPPPQAQSPQPAPKTSQPQPPQQLGDFLIRRLREGGAMAKDELRRLAVQEGYFAEADNADVQLQATLVHVVQAGFARELPNGKFAPPTLLDTIRLRRAI
jgi:hypothetical protein